MTATTHLPAVPWASAHRALLVTIGVALAVLVTAAIALVVLSGTGAGGTGTILAPIDAVVGGCSTAMPATPC
jgi:hypothetical protein